MKLEILYVLWPKQPNTIDNTEVDMQIHLFSIKAVMKQIHWSTRHSTGHLRGGCKIGILNGLNIVLEVVGRFYVETGGIRLNPKLED